MIKTASEFLSCASLRTGSVKVRGKEVSIRELSVAEREKMLEVAGKSSTDGEIFLLTSCVIDPDGKPLFTEEQAADLAKAAPEVVDAVSAAIMRLSGMGEDPKND